MNVKKLIFSIVLLAICHQINGEYDVNAYCTLVPDGTKLGSIENCETYYTCQNGIGTKGTCPSTQSFDKNAKGCRPKSDVQCYIGNDKPCQLKTEGFVPVLGTCNQYVYCKNNAEVGRGTCPNHQIFQQEKCVYGDCNDNINQGNTNTGLTSVCEIMPDSIFFGSSKTCKLWQKCTNGQLGSGNCPGDYVFDVPIQKCNFESGNMCSRVTGQDIQPDPTPTLPCDSGEKGNFNPDSATCSVYYECDGKNWIGKTCAVGYYFSIPDNQCVVRQKATPVNTCNRCEYTKKQFVNAVDPNCMGYQTCVNGVRGKDIKYCPDKSYFDELSQACIIDTNGKSTYSNANGACFNCIDECQGLTKATCQVTKRNCQCALNDEDDCILCTDTINNGKCTQEVDCDVVCGPLTGNECTPTQGCQCGLDDDDNCSNCPNEPVDGKCNASTGPTAPDCPALCENSQGCENVDSCTCGMNEGKCSDCSGDNICNGCMCAGSDCPAGNTDCECYEEDANTCIYCPDGVDTDGESCKTTGQD